MSLVTISAGAADFTDDEAITYEEAVDVLTAIGVVSGYQDGSFKPGTALNRGQAAKIICNLILGPTTAEALSTTEAPFKDVPADHVFAGYIAYCVSEGIISGYADGTFKPANPLTGYAFWKMLLGALGYDADIEGYNQPNWSVQVAKRGLNIELDKGLKGDFVGTKALNREEACLYAFNTLKAVMVDYGTKTAITVGDINITTSAECSEVENDAAIQLEVGDDDYLEFAEKYFEDLEGNKATDVFGRPATEWVWDDEDVGTYTKSPKYTFTFDKVAEAYADFDDEDLIEEIRDITGNKKLEYDGTTKLFINGAAKKTADLIGAGAGIIFELYTDKNDITTAVVLVPTAAQITDVEDELSKAETKKGATYEIELSYLDGTVIDSYYDEHDKEEELPGFDAETYTEDTVLVVFENWAEKTTDPGDDADYIMASYVAETVEGTLKTRAVTDKFDKQYLNIDGTKYPIAVTCNDVSELATGEEQTLYLTEEGFVVGAVGVNNDNIEDVYYVSGVYKTTSVKGTESWYAETVALDGTQADLKLEKNDALIPSELAAGEDDGYVALDAEDLPLFILTDEKQGDSKANDGKYDSALFDYEYAEGNEEDTYNDHFILAYGNLTDGDGESKDVKATDTKAYIDDVKVYMNDETAYVGIENQGDKLKVTTATGGMKMAADYIDDDETKYAYVIVLAHIDDEKLVTNFLYITEDLDAAVETDEILYIPANGNYEYDDGEIAIETAYFMADLSSEEITIDQDTWNHGAFSHFSIDEDDVYTLSDPGDMLDEVDDDTDGYYYAAVFSEETVYNKSLTIADATDIEDVDFSGAMVIDDRYDAGDYEYDREINSVSRLVSALKKYDVTADIYVKDGEIVFIAVIDTPEQ